MKRPGAIRLHMPLAVLVLILASLQCGRSSRSAGPNVLLLVVDALRADHMGVYGYSRDTTPRLDEYARRGVVFDRAYSQASATMPSVCTMFTSLYPSDHSVRAGGPLVLSQEVTTLAEVLKEVGYRTGCFSANTLFARGITGDDEQWSPGFDQGFEEFFVAPGSPSAYLSARALNERAVEWISKRGSGRPFFAYVHYMDSHLPYDAPVQFRERFLDSHESEIDWSKKMRQLWETGESIAEEARQHLISLYDAEIAYADHCIGEMLALLESKRVISDTLLIVTADHGEAFHEHKGIWVHGSGLYEELIHVPLIIVPPNAEVEAEPSRNGSIVGLIDLMPTILDHAGVPGEKRPDEMRGLSLATVLKDTTAVLQRDGVAAELKFVLRPKGDPQAFTSRALITERFKLIETDVRDKPTEILVFDLELDPLEQHSLADDPSSNKRVERLRAELDLVLQDQEEGAPQPLPRQVRDRLHAVGYL